MLEELTSMRVFYAVVILRHVTWLYERKETDRTLRVAINMFSNTKMLDREIETNQSGAAGSRREGRLPIKVLLIGLT